MHKPSAVLPAVAVVISAFGLSCDSPMPSVPGSAPTITSLEVFAPPSIAPGMSMQLRASARYSDRTIQDVTDRGQWFSERPEIVSVAPGGLATAQQLGEANVFVSYAERNSTRREIIVVPEGTFRVVGRVVEQDTPSAGVPGALVDPEIVPAATTDTSGWYRLYGLPGQATIRVSRNGYVTQVQTLTIQDHRTQNFALALSGPRPDMNGRFEMTIDAAEACRGRLPDALMRRRYMAVITQTGPRFQVELGEATFAPHANTVSGSLEGPEVFLDFYYGSFYYGGTSVGLPGNPAMAETLDDGTYFVVEGKASITQVGNNFTGPLSGTLWVLPTGGCFSRSHRVTLTR